MDDEATQPATQLVMDPRRLGDHASDLEDEDLCDIFCILHPASMSAINVAAHIADTAPEHTVSRASVPIKIRGDVDEPGTMELAEQGLVSRDIALRLSAKLKDPLAGWTFGRNTQRCDFVIKYPTANGAKRISNIHFRIYMTKDAVIMLEDQSTNGTQVEKVLLKSKDKENRTPFKHTLSNGHMISLVMTPPDEDIRFVVRIPQREGLFEDIFSRNVGEYFARMAALRAERDAQAVGNIAAQAPDIFAGHHLGSDDTAVSRRPKEWRGGAKYNKTRVIGKGAFATVYMITSKYDGTTFAAKELEKRKFIKNGILDQKVDQEMRIMSSIKHKNIVQYIEHVDWEDHLYIIMDYVPEGDLSTLINGRGYLSEVSVKSMTTQMLDALNYLHGMGITHRDIKPDNILVQSFAPFHVKLTDFGLSKRIDNDDTFMRTFCGTLLYCAPEVYSEYNQYLGNSPIHVRNAAGKKAKRYDQAVDLWSLAGVIFFSLCGNPPYPAKNGMTYQQLLESIMRRALDISPLQDAGVSQDGIDVIRSMLNIIPQYRPTIGQLMDSRWLRAGSVEVALEESDDEVTMVARGAGVEEQLKADELEQSTSQLSIAENYGDSLGTSDEIDLINAIVNRGDIPGSILNESSMISNESSFGFGQNTAKNQPRLFGEVNNSLLASSGVIPRVRLNLPFSQSANNLVQSTSITNTEPRDIPIASTESSQESAVLPATSILASSPTLGMATAPSLMGAESLVGALAMNSPSPAALNAPSLQSFGTAPVMDFKESMRSLRRQREPDYDEEHKAKRNKSSRLISDLNVPKNAFWDPHNKATHHDNYPDMLISDYFEAQEIAGLYGEEFKAGGSVFEQIMSAHRSASGTPEPPSRAHSEPANGGAPAPTLTRDERGLSEGTVILPQEGLSSGPSYPEKSTNGALMSILATNSNTDCFQAPHRILAKFIATSDSLLPQLTLPITDLLTTWGRGKGNKLCHRDVADVRIPKNAIKLVLWEQGLKPDSPVPTDPNNKYSFYIATKASQGIRVNGVMVPSNDYLKPQESVCKYWGKLCHGDIVDVWTDGSKDPPQCTRFRFECYWGSSKEPRQPGQFFSLVKSASQIDGLDHFTRWEESIWFNVKYQKDIKALKAKEARDKEKQKGKESLHVNMSSQKKN